MGKRENEKQNIFTEEWRTGKNVRGKFGNQVEFYTWVVDWVACRPWKHNSGEVNPPLLLVDFFLFHIQPCDVVPHIVKLKHHQIPFL